MTADAAQRADAGRVRRDSGENRCVSAGSETCDGLDNDCDSRVDESVEGPACALQQGVCASSSQRCNGEDGFLECSGIASYGESYEIEETRCDDGLDNDCDGAVDEGCSCSPGEVRPCGAAGACRGQQSCIDGRFGACSGGDPSEETCDGLDNDCDGTADENLAAPACTKSTGVCAGSTRLCGGEDGWLACDASRYGASYEAVETLCDGLDNDCDGTPDETLSGPSCALTHGVCAGRTQACGGALGFLACDAARYGADYQSAETRCDGLDNDCDGLSDEGCGCSVPGTQCAANEICACAALASTCDGGGACRSIFGDYAVAIESVQLPSSDPAGECWDFPCPGLPDPFIAVYADNVSIGTTASGGDTTSVSFSAARFRATLSQNSTVRFDVWDEDAFGVHDFAFGCTVSITATVLSNRTFTCTAGTNQIVRGRFIPYSP